MYHALKNEILFIQPLQLLPSFWVYQDLNFLEQTCDMLKVVKELYLINYQNIYFQG